MEQNLDKIRSILSGTQAMAQVGIPGLLLLLALSTLSAFFISYLYMFFYSNRATGSQVHRSFPLLGLSITGIFIAIQFSLPLSLGLLGALSIVRFRTPVKEPEEIGFIMLLIASSISCATFKLAFLGIVLAVATVALVAQSLARGVVPGFSRDGLLVLTLPVEDYQARQEEITRCVMAELRRGRLESLSKNDGSLVLSYTFQGLSQKSLLALQAELQRNAASMTLNVFYNRPGAL